MNITSNHSRHTIEGQRTNLNVMGNGNTLLIANSQLIVTVNGNQNVFKCTNSRLTITFNGNMNQIEANNSQLNYGFNGNNNLVTVDPASQHQLQFCNGIANTYPGQNNQQDSRNGRNRWRNSSRGQQTENQFNQGPQNNGFQYSYPQYNNQYPPMNQNFYYQQLPNSAYGWGIGSPGLFGQGGFLDNMGQGLNQMGNSLNTYFGNRPRRNYFFRPQGRQYGFDAQQPQTESRGLNQEQVNVLPRSRHVGKGGQCTVCLCDVEEGEEETFLMCFHSFHWECIRDWLKKTAKCPVCQFDVQAHLRGEEA